MSDDDFDYGPLRTYEVTWKSGHVETLQGHQVLFDSATEGFLMPGMSVPVHHPDPKFWIHGEFGGHWRLMLCAPEADLLSIRDVTDAETVAPASVTP